jgi:hypothetical protein
MLNVNKVGGFCDVGITKAYALIWLYLYSL